MHALARVPVAPPDWLIAVDDREGDDGKAKLRPEYIAPSSPSYAALGTPSARLHAAATPPSGSPLPSQPCRLLDVPQPLLALMQQYMDDRTAIAHLTTCRSAYAGYHRYPLKAPMPADAFVHAYASRAFERGFRVRHVLRWLAVAAIAVFVASFFIPQRDAATAVLAVSSVAVGFGLLLKAIAGDLRRPKDCCTSASCLPLLTKPGRLALPRVTQLSGVLTTTDVLPYLQHVVGELDIALSSKKANEYMVLRLPPKLQALRLVDGWAVRLEADTLPPGLTSLSLGKIKNSALPAGVLPASLTSLHLTADFDLSALAGADVLPAGLQRLAVESWPSILKAKASIALPASLVELDVRHMPNSPLPPLPPQLQVLRIGGHFDHPLNGVLPPSLRVLRLTGWWSQPISPAMFAGTTQLEELWLNDRPHDGACSFEMSWLPRSLQVLRLGDETSVDVRTRLDIPPQLRRFIVPRSMLATHAAELRERMAPLNVKVQQERFPHEFDD